MVSYELHDDDGSLLQAVEHATLDRGWWRHLPASRAPLRLSAPLARRAALVRTAGVSAPRSPPRAPPSALSKTRPLAVSPVIDSMRRTWSVGAYTARRLPFLLHPVVRAEDHGDPGGVDEGAALEADQDHRGSVDRRGQYLVQLTRDSQVQLPSTRMSRQPGCRILLGDVKALHRTFVVSKFRMVKNLPGIDSSRRSVPQAAEPRASLF